MPSLCLSCPSVARKRVASKSGTRRVEGAGRAEGHQRGRWRPALGLSAQGAIQPWAQGLGRSRCQNHLEGGCGRGAACRAPAAPAFRPPGLVPCLVGADGCGLEVTWGLEEVAGGSSALAGDAEKLGPSGLVGTGALRPCSAVPGPRAWPATSVTLRGRSSAPADSWAALDEPESSRSPPATMRVAGAPCGLDAEGGLD